MTRLREGRGARLGQAEVGGELLPQAARAESHLEGIAGPSRSAPPFCPLQPGAQGGAARGGPGEAGPGRRRTRGQECPPRDVDAPTSVFAPGVGLCGRPVGWGRDWGPLPLPEGGSVGAREGTSGPQGGAARHRGGPRTVAVGSTASCCHREFPVVSTPSRHPKFLPWPWALFLVLLRPRVLSHRTALSSWGFGPGTWRNLSPESPPPPLLRGPPQSPSPPPTAPKKADPKPKYQKCVLFFF